MAETSPNTQMLLDSYVDNQGLFHWDTDDGHTPLTVESEVDGTEIYVGADFDAYQMPTVEVVLRDNGEGVVPKRSEVTISPDCLAGFELKVSGEGYALPLPVMDSLEVEVENEFGIRRYVVPDADNKPVMSSVWDPTIRNTPDSQGQFTEAVPASPEDSLFIRKLVKDALSVTVRLATAARF